MFLRVRLEVVFEGEFGVLDSRVGGDMVFSGDGDFFKFERKGFEML